MKLPRLALAHGAVLAVPKALGFPFFANVQLALAWLRQVAPADVRHDDRSRSPTAYHIAADGRSPLLTR